MGKSRCAWRCRQRKMGSTSNDGWTESNEVSGGVTGLLPSIGISAHAATPFGQLERGAPHPASLDYAAQSCQHKRPTAKLQKLLLPSHAHGVAAAAGCRLACCRYQYGCPRCWHRPAMAGSEAAALLPAAAPAGCSTQLQHHKPAHTFSPPSHATQGVRCRHHELHHQPAPSSTFCPSASRVRACLMGSIAGVPQ